MNDNDTHTAFKVLIAWVGALAGGLTLNNVVLVATLIYTVLQIAITGLKLYREVKRGT